MNICILFILFNGAAYVTPQCISPTGVMYAPRDVVYMEHLPLHYNNIVFESPRFYLYNHFDNVRHIYNWRDYRRPRVQYHHVPRHQHHVHRSHKRHHRQHVKRHKQHKRLKQHKQHRSHKRHKQHKRFKKHRQHKKFKQHKRHKRRSKHSKRRR